MLHGFATLDGTRGYAEQFPAALANSFYRIAEDLHVSTLGLGTYLGKQDDATDRAYEEAALTALRCGINVLDTASNYRHGRSERALGSALRILLNANEIQRDQFVICTKAGFITPGAVPESLQEGDIAGGNHSMNPDFLEDQLNRSRAQLGLDTLDVFYIHNPETQLRYVPLDVFEQRLQAAFERCEKLVHDRRIRFYGTATWDGYRLPNQLDLPRIVDLARHVGGEDHHFRFIQLPFSLGMVEAYQNRDAQGVSLLKCAGRSGITVIASASLQQARLTRSLPEIVTGRIPGLTQDASRAIQFTRSTPGITVALVGMSNAEHVRENLEVTGIPPMGSPDYEKLYRPIEA